MDLIVPKVHHHFLQLTLIPTMVGIQIVVYKAIRFFITKCCYDRSIRFTLFQLRNTKVELIQGSEIGRTTLFWPLRARVGRAINFGDFYGKTGRATKNGDLKDNLVNFLECEYIYQNSYLK